MIFTTNWLKIKMNENNKKINFLLIGFGPHSKRIFHPIFENITNDSTLVLKAAIDLKSKQGRVEKYLDGKVVQPEMYYLNNDEPVQDQLNTSTIELLDSIVDKHSINAIIIATEPLVHRAYGTWALRAGLPVLMDKPISANMNVSSELSSAEKIAEDYYFLNDEYEKAKEKDPNIIFSLLAQRRYQTTIELIRNEISNCFAKTNCPVTNIQTFHSDGQWRTPTECVEEIYHGYNQGYGKCSHTGYHFFDIVPYILSAGLSESKFYEHIEVFSHAVRPLDVLSQFNLEDYERLFGAEEFSKNNPHSEAELHELMQDLGEVDCQSSIAFKNGDNVVTTALLNLTHNGFSRRSWPSIEGIELYKGNGRVSHESHIIQQGPFQTIHLHSYKSDDSNENADSNAEVVGTKRHIAIFIFRNNKLIGGKPTEVIRLDDIEKLEGESIGLLGKPKSKCFFEFVEALRGEITREEMKSDFSQHEHGAVLVSAVYQSMCNQLTGSSPLIKMPLEMTGDNTSTFNAQKVRVC
ncbi:Gfo/Idh/MocA family oxidoreductase [Vibrio cyclitrophicus]|uniref:Gfo/Idh/MocA family oxidoreductase n=1 Tax=Vibrio cyclitrophicus TaxID=47951 RepID=UPI00029A984A|nr:hypothetical protein OAM_16650 [Vibrio cyclitrophicus ZF14]